MMVCSPTGEENYRKLKSCLGEDAIRHLVTLWNDRYPANAIASDLSPKRSLTELRKRFISHTASKKATNADTDVAIAKHLDSTSPVVAKNFRPSKPSTWKETPREWLTNFDIDAVMAQYNMMPEFKYRFLGVFPVDFAEPLPELGGQCYTPEMCALRLSDIVKTGTKYTGFIINLDKHNESGSHWTSIFAVLDPELPSYGAYYYDSIGRSWPTEIERYLKTWQTQMKKLYPKTPFELQWSRAQHQHANTECGMFSMIFQILWIERLRFDERRRLNKAKDDEKEAKLLAKERDIPKATKRLLQDKAPVTFDMIVGLPLKDMNVYSMRNVLYKNQAGGKKKVT